MACEFDARDMAAIATAQKLRPAVLMTRQATRARTLAAIRAAAKTLRSGDLFFLSYSGHGGQMPDVSGEEEDKKDETWCLYDGELIDDELYVELSKFAAGVRVLVLSDSCHSGTATRARPEPVPKGMRSKMMPPDIARKTYLKNKKFYDTLQKNISKEAGGKGLPDPDTMLALVSTDPRVTEIVKNFKPSVILISGCQDNQTSMDGPQNGAFTGQLLKVWKKGGFKGDHVKFHGEIVSGLPSSQTPNLFPLGPSGPFLKQKPFTV
jgi:hypothetical protein